MRTLKKIIFQLDLHQRVLITLILPQCLSTQTIPLSPNIGFWIPLSVFKLSTQYPYYSQVFEYSVKNTLIDHNACSGFFNVPEGTPQHGRRISIPEGAYVTPEQRRLSEQDGIPRYTVSAIFSNPGKKTSFCI